MGTLQQNAFVLTDKICFFGESYLSLSSGELHLIPQAAVDVNGSKFFITCVSVIFILNQCISAVMHF